MTSLENLDNGYYASLRGDDIQRFEDQYKQNLNELDEEAIRDRLKQELTDNHSPKLELIEAIISGFDQDENAIGTQKSGFSFAFETPLIEEVEDPADVILVQDDFESCSLHVVTCEVGEPKETDWVNRINTIYGQYQVDSNLEKLSNQIGIQSIESIGYSLVSTAPNLRGMDTKQVVQEAEPDRVSIWSCDRWQRELRHHEGRVGHYKLKKLLESGFDYLKIQNRIEFIVGSHALIGIEEILKTILKRSLGDDEHQKEFYQSTFRKVFESHISLGCEGEERESVIDREVARLLHLALEIGILSDESDAINSTKDYRMVFRGKSPERVAKKAEEKYLDTMKTKKREEQAFKHTKSNFDRQQSGFDDSGDFQLDD